MACFVESGKRSSGSLKIKLPLSFGVRKSTRERKAPKKDDEVEKFFDSDDSDNDNKSKKQSRKKKVSSVSNFVSFHKFIELTMWVCLFISILYLLILSVHEALVTFCLLIS